MKIMHLQFGPVEYVGISPIIKATRTSPIEAYKSAQPTHPLQVPCKMRGRENGYGHHIEGDLISFDAPAMVQHEWGRDAREHDSTYCGWCYRLAIVPLLNKGPFWTLILNIFWHILGYSESYLNGNSRFFISRLREFMHPCESLIWDSRDG